MQQRPGTARVPGTATRGFPARNVRRRRRAAEPTASSRRATLVLALWLATGACAYLAASSLSGLRNWSLGLLVLAVMIVANMLVARTDPKRVITVSFSVGVALLYTGLVFSAWHFGGQGSVEVMVGAIAIVDLALVGLSLAELGAITLAMAGIYSVIS